MRTFPYSSSTIIFSSHLPFQICYVVVYDDFSLDTDDGQDKTEDAAPDDDDDGDLGQWSAGQGGYGCADDEQGAIHTQVWRAIQVKDGKLLTVEIEMFINIDNKEFICSGPYFVHVNQVDNQSNLQTCVCVPSV